VKKFRLLVFVLSLTLMSLGSGLFNFETSIIEAQTKPLTYQEIITALNTKVPNKSYKTKAQVLNFLMAQVKKRGVDKPLSKEKEELLRESGASVKLITLIMNNVRDGLDPLPTPVSNIPIKVLPTPTNPVNVGVMNSRARSLTKPAYPSAAKKAGVAGRVEIQILIDEEGNVLEAKAISGPSVLRSPALSAALQSTFNPVKVGDKPVRAFGTIIYNFINQ
jgi:hypothetical protein